MEPVFCSDSQQRAQSSPSTDFTKCVICQKDSDDTLNNVTKRGVPRLIEAILDNKDHVYDRLCHDISEEDHFLSRKPVCHRSCRSDYTHKRHLLVKQNDKR